MLARLLPIRNTESEPVNSPRKGSVFQSPDDHRQDRLDILHRLVSDPPNTYYFKANSDEMEIFGIKKGSLLIVERSTPPTGGEIVIALNNGEWLVRQFINHVKRKYLTTGRENDKLLEVNKETEIIIWGVVTWCCCPQTEVYNISFY